MARQGTRWSFFGSGRANSPSSSQPLTVGLPGLWKAMILTSFLVNVILLFVVVFLLFFLLWWRTEISNTTVGVQGFARANIVELRDVVDQLQAAHIKTTIPLSQPLPVNLNVPIDQATLVTTTVDVPISVPASIDMGAFGQLYPNVNLNLPAGTPLLIRLKLDVPLQTTIPVRLDVPVDIAMSDTELAPQFRRLGDVVDRLVGPFAPLLGIEMAPPGEQPPAPPPAQPTAAPPAP